MFYLAICLWMSYGQLEHMDVTAIIELQEPFAGELGVVICDDVVGNPEAMDDVSEEQHGLL
jgi:hypothetical protein